MAFLSFGCTLAADAQQLEEKDISGSPQVTGGKSALLRPSDGFDPGGGYTVEMRLRVGNGEDSHVDIFGAAGARKGFKFSVADSSLSYVNPASVPYPEVIYERLNRGKDVVLRFAVTDKDSVFVWRNGVPAGRFSMKNAPLPLETVDGEGAESANLLVNGDFESMADTTYQVIAEEDNATCLATMDGWFIYPNFDVWNSRTYLDTSGGNTVLRMQRYSWSSDKQWADATVRQVADVVPGTPYKLSFLARGGEHEGVYYGYAKVEEVETGKSETVDIENVEDMQAYSLEYVPSADCRQLRVLFGLKFPGGLLDWGEVPTVPVYIDDVKLGGKSVSYMDKALGFNASDDVEVEYLAYDLSGAYAPVTADIVTDRQTVEIDNTAGGTVATLHVTGKGLQAGEMIEFLPSPYVTVSPAKLPYNANNQQVRIVYDGTRPLVSDTLWMRSGETVRCLLLQLKGKALESKSIAGAAQSKGETEYSVANTATQGYTMEVRARVNAGAQDGIRLYSSGTDGKGFGFFVADSALVADNPKSLNENPLTLKSRKNSDMLHTYRVAVTKDDQVFVYRDGNAIDTLDATGFVIPAEFTGGPDLSNEENLLVNSEFDGAYSTTYAVEEGPDKAFASQIQGWDIYPIDAWNTRQYITGWEMSEESGYDKTNKALKLERYDWNPGYTDGYVSQAVDVVGGQKYTLKVLAKGGINASVKYGYIRLEEVQDRAKGITQEITSDDMKEYTLEYNPTSACKQLRVVFGLTSPGAIGEWGSVPKVPIYIDKPVLTGPKVKGTGNIGFRADMDTEVEYFAYDLTGAYAPAVPEIQVSQDTVRIDKTDGSVVLRITGVNLNEGEDIRLYAPAGIELSKDRLAYDSNKAMVAVRLVTWLKNYDVDLILRSGTTRKVVRIEGNGSDLPEKVLSTAPLYTGDDDSWSRTEAEGFTPSDDGYTVEFQMKSALANSEFRWYGVDKEGTGTQPYVESKYVGVYNGKDKNRLKGMDNTDAAHTYRYAVTPDGNVFFYRDATPVDTFSVRDYALPEGFADGEGEVKENLLYNGGFEGRWSDYVMPDDPEKAVFTNYVEGWTIMDPNNGWNARTYISTAPVTDALGEDNHVAGLERYQWEDGYDDGKLSQVVSVVPGTTYTLTAFAKGGFRISDDTPLGYIRIEEVQNTEKNVSVTLDEHSRYEFKPYTLSYVPGEDCEQIRVVLGIQKAGKGNQSEKAWFDEVCLTGQARTFAQQIGFVKANADLEYFTYDVTGAYAPILPKINVDADRIDFAKTLDERQLSVSTSDVRAVDEIELVASGGFMVEPETLPANADAQTVTVTFVGTKNRSGSLTIKAGDFVKVVPLSGKASPLQEKDLSASPVYTDAAGQYSVGVGTFNPGKAGYTIELAGSLEEYSGSSFEVGAVNSRDRGVTLTISDEFVATSYDKGNIEFVGNGMVANIGDFVYRVTVTPDNLAYIFKDKEIIDTLDLNNYPVNDIFQVEGESVESDNLVKNGNFNGDYDYTQYEEAYMLSSLEGWRMTGIDEWNARAYIQADAENPGNNVLNLARYDWNPGWADGMVTQVVNVCPDTKYEFSALVKGGQESGLNLAWMGYTEAGTGKTASINVSGGNEWTEKVMSFTTSSECTQVKLSFWLSSSGQQPGPKCNFYVRDVALKGMKPVFSPGIYLKSDGDFNLKYFTYDLTGAYIPVGSTVGVEDIRDDMALENVAWRTGAGNLYLRNVPEGSRVEVYNYGGMQVFRTENYAGGSAIALGKGYYIVRIVSSGKATTLKVFCR